MLLKIFISLFLSLSFISCGSAPKIEACLIYVPATLREPDAVPEDNRFDLIVGECVTAKGESITRQITEMHKYVAIPHDDAITYFQYCQDKK